MTGSNGDMLAGSMVRTCVFHGTVRRADLPCPECEAQQPSGGWEAEKGGVKFDQNKPRMDLLDAYAIEELSKVLTFGAQKYAPHNWRKGIGISRLIAASMRHLFAIARGEDTDPETGLAHGAHLMCCAMFIVWTLRFKPEMDDRWKEPTDSGRVTATEILNRLKK